MSLSKRLDKYDRKFQDFYNNHRRLFLYGKGKIAEKVFSYLYERNIKISGVIVSKLEDKCYFHEVPVIKFEESELTSEDGVIVATGYALQYEIYDTIRSKYPYVDIMLQNVFPFSGVLRPNKMNEMNKIDLAQKVFSNYELDNIGEFFHTDKSHSYHDYLRKYELFFQPWRNSEFTLMELGVLRGESLRTWEKYFSRAKIVGVDIDEESKKYESKNCEIVILDLANEKNLLHLGTWNPSIIIDDASHIWSHQIKALFLLWKTLPHGGIYIVEDIETSFPEAGFCGYDDAIVSAFDICSAISEVITSGCRLRVPNLFSDEIENIGKETEMISFIKGSCIMVKK